jgi:hypothetical protein
MEDSMGTAKGSRWAPVAQAWIEHPQVGADEVAVLTVLSLHADSDGVCWPSQGLIAEKLKRSRAWVIKIINRLEEFGLVVRTRRHHASGGLRSCLYRLEGRPGATGTEDRQRRDNGCHGHDREQTNSEKQESPPPDAREGRAVAEIVDPGWIPSAEDVAWAAIHRPDANLLRHTERFITTCQAKGYRYRDHGAAWRSWLLDNKGNDCHDPSRRPDAMRSDRLSHRPDSDRLAERNRAEADACLRRILARRAGLDGPGR